MSQRSMRKYDKEFKLNAINLFLEKGLSYKQISDELGIPQSTLIGWMKAYNKNKNNAFPGKGHTNNENAEVVQLRKELAIAREERDILKKALGIFSSTKK